MTRLRSLLPVALVAALALLGRALPGVAGQVALYPVLGVAPGMALALLLTPPGGPSWTLGLALAPLAATCAGAALVLGGLPIAATARGIAVAGVLAWGLLALRAGGRDRARAAADAPGPDLRVLIPLALALAVATSLPWLVNAWLRVRSDSWIHAGLVWEIVRHGLPPEDSRFVGLPLNYVWFFNLFIALQTQLTGRDPFVFMMIFNAVNFGVCAALVYRMALELWRDRAAAAGAALLVPVGLNAGMWMLWPLTLLRALLGSTRGWVDIMNQVKDVRWGTCDVIFSLDAPLASMVNLLDKFTVGTALSYAWLMMLVVLWALLVWLREGRRATLVWAAAGAAGMLFFHGVVGLSALPVALGTLGLTWLASFRWPWLPGRGRLVAFALALLAGAAAAGPYTRSISSGWTTEKSGVHHHFFHLGVNMAWTLLTSLLVVGLLARRPLARLVRERHPAGLVLALFTLAMTAFALIVHLPLDNETKFVFQVFFPLVLLAGPAVLPFVRATRARLGVPLGTVALILLFLVSPVVLLANYAADPAGRRDPATAPAPGEDALYAWIRAHVPLDGFLTDHGGRDLVMVKGQRRLWVGTIFGPDKAAFPEAEMARRRAVEADLYGPARALEEDARALTGLGRPAYVLYRATDFPDRAPWEALERDPGRFERVYSADGYRLYRVRPPR